MVFVVGARRSGTFWLQRMLTAHPQIVGVPTESHLFSHGLSPLLERFHHGVKGSTQVGAVYVDRTALTLALRNLCDTAFAPFLVPPATRLSERTPLHALSISTIARVYPDAQIVHIIRDGRDVTRSISVQAWGTGELRAAAREWRDTVTAARSHAPPDTYREVRYEALLRNPDQALTSIFEWLGVASDGPALTSALTEAGVQRNLDPTHSQPASSKWHHVWSRRELRAFECEAGELLSELGYLRESVPSSSSALRALAREARRNLRSSVRQAERRGGAVIDPREHWREGQRTVDLVVAALNHEPDQVRSLLRPDFIFETDGSPVAGEPAVNALIEHARADAALRGRQVAGTAVPEPGTRSFAVSLTFQAPDGSVAHRHLSIEPREGLVAMIRTRSGAEA
jgi:hypothetical protein